MRCVCVSCFVPVLGLVVARVCLCVCVLHSALFDTSFLNFLRLSGLARRCGLVLVLCDLRQHNHSPLAAGGEEWPPAAGLTADWTISTGKRQLPNCRFS